ncbi:hypothetical protein SAMN06264867_102217 [Halorubrum cibi]|uniref:Uncharacterized protein n=1 Tax=Halorubrum cibi TaxID=413815 RepID=A0A521BEA6_9EURY|nr:hypothetical protein SAMN06264867_102217 [Halorubrum cibi]
MATIVGTTDGSVVVFVEESSTRLRGGDLTATDASENE